MAVESTFQDIGPLRVFERTQAAFAYQQDAASEGRPVSLMLAGGLLALVSAAFCGLLARQIWLANEVPSGSGLWGVSLLFVLYVGGLYVFCLGYQLYDVGRALRLTLIFAVISIIALTIVIGTFVVLAKLRSGATVLTGAGDKAGPLVGMLGTFEGDDEAARGERDPLDFLIRCPHCHDDFTPTPPAAVCPWCGKAALSV